MISSHRKKADKPENEADPIISPSPSSPATHKSTTKKEKTPEQDFLKGEKNLANQSYKKAKKYYKRAARANYEGANEKLKEVKRLLASASPTAPSPAVQLLVDDIVAAGIDFQQIEIGARLGRGAYGTVFLARFQSKPVAIKRFNFSILHSPASEQERFKKELAAMTEQFNREISPLTQLHSAYLVKYFGFTYDPESRAYSLVMEYFHKGSLFNLLQGEQQLSWAQRYQMACDIATGMVYLHGENMVHGDLRTANIMVDNNHRIKINDYGYLDLKSIFYMPNTEEGEIKRILAPEFRKKATVKIKDRYEVEMPDNEYIAMLTKENDVYNYGDILWELATRKDSSTAEIKTITPTTPLPIVSIMTKCWTSNPAQRPHMVGIVDILLKHRSLFSPSELEQSPSLTEEQSKPLKTEEKTAPHVKSPTLG